MALMKYREQNEVVWVGARPAHHGTQVNGYANHTGAASTDLYTVPTGYKLFITYVSFFGIKDTAVGDATLDVYDDVPAFFQRIAGSRIPNLGTVGMGAGLPFPIEVPADYLIRFITTGGVSGGASFYGWIE